MIGIIVLLGLSWVLLYTQKQRLSVLGLSPNIKRLRQFFTGLLVATVLCTLTQFLELRLTGAQWVLSDHSSLSSTLNSLFWDFKSVLTEELMFRGALLYLLIKKLGERKAIFISALVFGIYHWFSMGLLGNPVAMIVILIGTGLMGYVWASAYAKTQSMMLAFGLHLGWNMTFNTFFSKGPLGEVTLIAEGAQELTGWFSLINLLSWLIVVPFLLFLFVKYWVKPIEN